jgi:hypothetical protein
VSGYLIIPVILSAFQNVYLAPVASHVPAVLIQMTLILNYLTCLVAVITFAVNTSRDSIPPLVKTLFTILCMATAYICVITLVRGAEPLAAFAAYRNFSTPFIFTMVAAMAGLNTVKTNIHRFSTLFLATAAGVLSFGVIDLFFPGIWIEIGVGELWISKGIGIKTTSGIPANWYSAELINGSPVRRMVASFADPVNLGALLFAAFIIAWFSRRWFVGGAALVGAVLAVSKGALLSCLVFLTVLAWRSRSPILKLLVPVFSLILGLGFVFWSQENASGSLFRHISGFTAGFASLVQNPFGSGLGNSGILAGLFSSNVDTEVGESAVGTVIGQLGIGGLIVLISLYYFLYKAVRDSTSGRTRVLGLTLVWSLVLNSMFNEVTMSPNSAGPYCIAIGLIYSANLKSNV